MREQSDTPTRRPAGSPEAAEPLLADGAAASAPIPIRPNAARSRGREAGRGVERPPYAEFLDGLHAARMRGASED